VGSWKNGEFSTKSLHRFILNAGVKDYRMMDMWKTKCPLEQKKNCVRGHIQSATQLVTRNWSGDKLYML
jgi:hypothetical protein